MSAWDPNFRRRARPGRMRASEAEVVPIKRLRGLEEFEMPGFVGRMARVEQAGRRAWWALVVAVVLTGIAIGWTI